jgi:NADH-quinone oxidoreductase subunit J
VPRTGPIQLARHRGADRRCGAYPETIGSLLYTRYLFVFEGQGLVLLVAMIGAIVSPAWRQAQNVAPERVVRRMPRNTKAVVRQGSRTVTIGLKYPFVAAILFTMGVLGIFLNRRRT